MKFIDIINSKMFLNGLMEIVAKKDRAITLKLDDQISFLTQSVFK